MTMFKLIDIRTVAYIIVMLLNSEVDKFQMLFGNCGTPHWRSVYIYGSGMQLKSPNLRVLNQMGADYKEEQFKLIN